MKRNKNKVKIPRDLERESWKPGNTKKSCGSDFYLPFNTDKNLVSHEALKEKLNGKPINKCYT